jgi:AcrR family transcriptional regulator
MPACQNRLKLQSTAAEEFALSGYDGANINTISIHAGFAKGTIYNYFPSKRALLLALIDTTAQ